jgi:hypothetical protein
LGEVTGPPHIDAEGGQEPRGQLAPTDGL